MADSATADFASARSTWPALLLITAVFACAFYANLALTVTNPEYYRFFPPYKPHVNAAKQNGFMGGEYYRIAQSLAAGKGFANPFPRPTGPTAWQPPVYPLFIAGLLWAFDGDLDAMTAARVFVQVLVLVGTGLLILALVRQTTNHVGLGVAVAVYLGALLWNFQTYFQRTQDICFVLLCFGLIIAGLCWGRPLSTWRRAGIWGLLGGFGAMTSPVVGFAWGVLTLASGIRQQSFSRLAVACLCCGLALAPWTIRNYLVFGRFIPMKSNLALELYQSQLLPTGLLTSYQHHPGGLQNKEGREYLRLGEMAYMDRKWEQFCQSVAADPLDFGDRVARRFLAATLWYEPFGGPGRPWVLWLKRLTHPLPFLALLFLLFSSTWKPLHPAQWAVIGLYGLYLAPYVLASYYDRYAGPLLGVKVLLVVWAADRVLAVCRDKMSRAQCRVASVLVAS